MSFYIRAKTIEDIEFNAKYDNQPDVCPICHNKIKPIPLDAFYFKKHPSHYPLQIIFLCPNSECAFLFIAYYRESTFRETRAGFPSEVLILSDLAPIRYEKQIFSEEITTLSLDFVEIFNQASAAESNNLDQVAGPGYRKALEFLIKDFLIDLDPDNENEIKIKSLGRCIELIKNDRIKNIASRAAWLGNDETHYMRTWGDKDINDLKNLIRLTVNFIENELISAKYETEMPNSKGNKDK